MKYLKVLLLVVVMTITACGNSSKDQQVEFNIQQVGDKLFIVQNDYDYVAFGIQGMSSGGKYYNAVVEESGVFAIMGDAVTLGDTAVVQIHQKFQEVGVGEPIYFPGGIIDSVEIEYSLTDERGNYLSEHSHLTTFKVKH